MKTSRSIISVIILFAVHVSTAQTLSQKTNEFHLSFKDKGLPTTGPLPTIRWVFPVLDFTSSQQNYLQIEADVESSNLAEEIKIVIGNNTDGSLLGTKNIKFKPSEKKVNVKHSVFLPDGNNFISVEVKTKDGVIISDKRNIMIGAGAEDNLLSIDRKDYALLFATDKYEHWDDLVNPVDDAHAVAKELKEKYGFEVEIVENATMEEVWEKLRLYNERKFKPQDQLMIFFAGHGHYDESFGEGFVVAKNSLQKDLSRSTYLSHNRLRGVISNIPCNHILLLMDVCFGGTLDPVIARSRGAKENQVSINEMVVRKLRYRTRKYITSGGKEYVSDGIPGKHSPFAESIIESLRSWGGEDRVLTLAEMHTYLEKLKQQPRVGSFADDEALGDFVFVGKR